MFRFSKTEKWSQPIHDELDPHENVSCFASIKEDVAYCVTIDDFGFVELFSEVDVRRNLIHQDLISFRVIPIEHD